MSLEDHLVIGQPMLPEATDNLLVWDCFRYIGTFRSGGQLILFWSAYAHDDPIECFAYAEITDAELNSFVTEMSQGGPRGSRADEHHPLLTNRRIVVGLSDQNLLLSRVVVIERSGPKVFEEIDRLFPAPENAE